MGLQSDYDKSYYQYGYWSSYLPPMSDLNLNIAFRFGTLRGRKT